MTIEIHEHTHVYKIWYVDMLPNVGNMLAIVLRDPPGEWRATYRFRWYRDDKTFDSKDERSWYAVTPTDGGTATREKLVEMFETLMVLHTKHWQTNISRVHVDAVGAKAIEVLTKQPWAKHKLLD
jgi:hypothetical protein